MERSSLHSPATGEQQIELANLCYEIGQLKGRTALQVGSAVFRTNSVLSLGYDGTGHLTQEQCDAALRIAYRWLQQARESA